MPEYQREHKLSAKHIVEEAMTAALVQKCNKCTKPFVKLSGCNKMTCNCGNLQCYVCGESIRDYRHFENGKCPLHEQTDARLDSKIMNAQEEAVKKVMEEEAGLKEEDLRVEAARNAQGPPSQLPPGAIDGPRHYLGPNPLYQPDLQIDPIHLGHLMFLNGHVPFARNMGVPPFDQNAFQVCFLPYSRLTRKGAVGQGNRDFDVARIQRHPTYYINGPPLPPYIAPPVVGHEPPQLPPGVQRHIRFQNHPTLPPRANAPAKPVKRRRGTEQY
jgi:hypothetical protein